MHTEREDTDLGKK